MPWDFKWFGSEEPQRQPGTTPGVGGPGVGGVCSAARATRRHRAPVDMSEFPQKHDLRHAASHLGIAFSGRKGDSGTFSYTCLAVKCNHYADVMRRCVINVGRHAGQAATSEYTVLALTA